MMKPKISRVGSDACRLALVIEETILAEDASYIHASYALALVLLGTLRDTSDRPEILDRTIDVLRSMIGEMESFLRDLEEAERPC